MSKMSPEEEDAVQEELEKLQREAMVRLYPCQDSDQILKLIRSFCSLPSRTLWRSQSIFPKCLSRSQRRWKKYQRVSSVSCLPFISSADYSQAVSQRQESLYRRSSGTQVQRDLSGLLGATGVS